jgi:hypothetical protein
LPELASDDRPFIAAKLGVNELTEIDALEPPPEVLVPPPEVLVAPDVAEPVEPAPEVELLLLDELPHAATRTATTIMGTTARNLPAMHALLAMGRRPSIRLQFLSCAPL